MHIFLFGPKIKISKINESPEHTCKEMRMKIENWLKHSEVVLQNLNDHSAGGRLSG